MADDRQLLFQSGGYRKLKWSGLFMDAPESDLSDLSDLSDKHSPL